MTTCFSSEACEIRSELRPFELSGYHSMALSQVSANRASTFPDEPSIIGRIDILEFFRFCHCVHEKLEPLLRVFLSASGNCNGYEVKKCRVGWWKFSNAREGVLPVIAVAKNADSWLCPLHLDGDVSGTQSRPLPFWISFFLLADTLTNACVRVRKKYKEWVWIMGKNRLGKTHQKHAGGTKARVHVHRAEALGLHCQCWCKQT